MAATTLKEFTLEEVAQVSTFIRFPATSDFDCPQHNTPDDLVRVPSPILCLAHISFSGS